MSREQSCGERGVQINMAVRYVIRKAWVGVHGWAGAAEVGGIEPIGPRDLLSKNGGSSSL